MLVKVRSSYAALRAGSTLEGAATDQLTPTRDDQIGELQARCNAQAEMIVKMIVYLNTTGAMSDEFVLSLIPGYERA